MTASSPQPHYTAVVIGSGFGGTMTGLSLAREFNIRKKNETLLMLERGTWWTTPVGTIQDKEVKTADFLRQQKQPVQYWPSAEHLRGFIDIVLRCARRKGNEDGLYDLTRFGKSGFLGIGAENDGVSILRASGVGGGSLVYANVTIQPPDLVFNDPRWPVQWDQAARNQWFDLARDAIGLGVVYALEKRAGTDNPKLAVNTGLSNIAARSARLDPRWNVLPDPNNKRGIKRIDLTRSDPKGDHSNDLWIDRARVFQTAMADGLADDYGTVDSSINDITPEPTPFDPKGAPKNYCERQGRCIVGCLPGARHTLNKQLMAAVLGKPDGTPPLYPNMSVQALAEVDIIRSRAGGGYEIEYAIRSASDPSQTTTHKVTADRVIVSAGCVGTNEILLRSRERGGLANLSDKVGFGFSTNGDYLAFLENTKERVSLTRGPVTTSYAHFQKDPATFHTIEDNGIPRALSSITGLGVPLVRSLANGSTGRLVVLWTLTLWLLRRFRHFVAAFFRDAVERQDIFQSEDEYTNNIMCIAAMGREASIGQFRLGKGSSETALRVARTDGKGFHEDPIYDSIRATLDRFAAKLTGNAAARFINPFLTPAADALGSKSITLSHPLGGCRMAANAAEGVVDEYGRVFDKTRSGNQPFYPGLYVADGAMIPTALGVNPSLTISALSLRSAAKIVEELPA